MKDWPQTVTELTAHLRNLRGGAPEVMKAFSNIANAALAAKALDGKTKELIALGISVAIRCDDCIAFHAKAALKQGANREEIMEALGMAVYMGAGPSVMYATHALDAFTQFENENTLAPVMSALLPKADMCAALADVCSGPKADIRTVESMCRKFSACVQIESSRIAI